MLTPTINKGLWAAAFAIIAAALAVTAAALAVTAAALAVITSLKPTPAKPDGPVATLDAFTLADFTRDSTRCYDRRSQPGRSIVDSHVHFRPFGGEAVPFEEVIGYMRKTGVLFTNVYGIGQMLPAASHCTYYRDCPDTRLTPTLRNDFVNAAELAAKRPDDIKVTLAMTFPDLANPETVLDRMKLLDTEYPGLFQWMGEVNLVKQAIFSNGQDAVPREAIPDWAPFMAELREREMPMAIHADLGNEKDPTRYLGLMERVLHTYPDNTIIWMHMGLSRELKTMDPRHHATIMEEMLDRYPNLMLDISWRVIDDAYFSKPEGQAVYTQFLNDHARRILPGTDFVASRDKTFEVYKEELEVTSRILRYLNDDAFREIALGANYFRLLKLDYEAPEIC